MLNYLIKNGSERVVTSAREHIYDLRSLENYSFVDDTGKDQGVNIRHKVKELIDFIQDDDRLREERKKAKKNKDKYIGMSSDMMGMRSGMFILGYFCNCFYYLILVLSNCFLLHYRNVCAMYLNFTFTSLSNSIYHFYCNVIINAYIFNSK